MNGPSGTPGTYKRPDGVLVPPELAQTLHDALTVFTKVRRDRARVRATPQELALISALGDAAHGHLPCSERTDPVAVVSGLLATVDEIAAELDTTPRTVRNRCAAGTLPFPAVRIGHEWLIIRDREGVLS